MPEVMDQVTQQTIDLAKNALQGDLAKDATTQGYNTTTGLTGYSLEAPAKNLFPVLSPLRNSISRVKAKIGSPAAHWKAIMGINTTNQRSSTGFGYAGNLISTKEMDFMAMYKVVSLGDTVEYDAEIQAREFQDLRATAGVNLLYALMIQEELELLGGQNYALPTPGTVTLTPASTGGTIGAVNVAVAVAVRTIQGYYDGYNGIASATATSGTLTGSTNSVAATVAAVPGAVVYDWYVGTSGGTLYYYTSTSAPSVTVTSVPTAAQSAPTSTLPQLADPVDGTAPTTDGTADPDAFNGILASLTGDWVNGAFGQRGSGTPTGSYFKSLDGASLTGNTGTIQEIDDALSYLWGNAKISPTKILCNSVEHVNISNKVIESGGAYTLFRPDAVGERQNVVGGQLVETYLNKAVNGRPIPLETHPYLPQGTIILLTDKLPYPNNKVPNVMEVETLQEYQQIEYATSRQVGQANGGPRYDFEVRAQETFKNYFPGGMAVISGVGA